MTQTIAEIEEDLARSRAALRANLSALADRMTVKHVLTDVVLTPGFLSSAAKIAAPFAALAVAGGVLKYATRDTPETAATPSTASQRVRAALAGLVDKTRRANPTPARRLAYPKLTQKPGRLHPLLLVAAAAAAAGGAAALAPMSRAETRLAQRQLRFAARQASQAAKTLADEARSISDMAAGYAKQSVAELRAS
jgi:hypothetical protein